MLVLQQVLVRARLRLSKVKARDCQCYVQRQLLENDDAPDGIPRGTCEEALSGFQGGVLTFAPVALSWMRGPVGAGGRSGGAPIPSGMTFTRMMSSSTQVYL